MRNKIWPDESILVFQPMGFLYGENTLVKETDLADQQLIANNTNQDRD